MCIRDRRYGAPLNLESDRATTTRADPSSLSSLSLIHISEPTSQAESSYAVFCLKTTRQPPTSTPLYSSAASDVYKRPEIRSPPQSRIRPSHYDACRPVVAFISVSYTHLRAHEPGRKLVCRLLLENDTATPHIYTSLFVGSVRCV